MSSFYFLFFLTLGLGIASILLFVKRNKFGRRPLALTASSFVVALAILIPLGNQPISSGDEEPITTETHSTEEADVEPVDADKPTQEELNAQMKADAVAIDYNEFYGSNPPLHKKIFIDGEIIDIRDDATWDTVLIDTGDGTYHIMSANVTNVEYKLGDVVRAYGSITEYDSETAIFSSFLEVNEEATIANNEPMITKEEALQIKEGMNYAEVVAIIGANGELTNESITEAFTHTAYKWKNDDGSYAFIQFDDLQTNEPVVSSFMFNDLK